MTAMSAADAGAAAAIVIAAKPRAAAENFLIAVSPSLQFRHPMKPRLHLRSLASRAQRVVCVGRYPRNRMATLKCNLLMHKEVHYSASSLGDGSLPGCSRDCAAWAGCCVCDSNVPHRGAAFVDVTLQAGAAGCLAPTSDPGKRRGQETPYLLEIVGAGEGNRTLVFSLEGCCSTIELHPRWR